MPTEPLARWPLVTFMAAPSTEARYCRGPEQPSVRVPSHLDRTRTGPRRKPAHPSCPAPDVRHAGRRRPQRGQASSCLCRAGQGQAVCRAAVRPAADTTEVPPSFGGWEAARSASAAAELPDPLNPRSCTRPTVAGTQRTLERDEKGVRDVDRGCDPQTVPVPRFPDEKALGAGVPTTRRAGTWELVVPLLADDLVRSAGAGSPGRPCQPPGRRGRTG